MFYLYRIKLIKIILTANEVAELIAQHISNKGIELNTTQIKCEDVVIDLDTQPGLEEIAKKADTFPHLYARRSTSPSSDRQP